MSETINVIGEGTYGCVHKPSLKCKNAPGQNYHNKVSKILRNKDAKKEIAEYKKVDSADKDGDFYLGKPESCELNEKDASNIKGIEKCKISPDILARLKSYQLLIMEDGGVNISDYVERMKTWSQSEMSTELCEKFLLEALRLFSGLNAFEKHGLVHHDLKPQNIVYNERTNRLNFIDFGLMENHKTIINDAKKSKYAWDIFHWSYPWELEVLNKNLFLTIERSAANAQNMIRSFFDKYTARDDTYYLHASTFCRYALDSKSPTFGADWNKYITDYENTIRQDIANMDYDEFLEKSIGTIDVYGVGIALSYWFFAAKKHLEPAHIVTLGEIFKRMISARLSTRYTVQQCLEEYEAFLIGSGLLEKYDMEIKDHIVIDRNAPPRIRPILKLAAPKNTRINPAFADADPKPCPEGKEINPKTGRCIKIKTRPDCPEGTIRNETTGRCVKVKTEKKCPEGKVINPKTGRCIKNKTEKKCPEGKVINPKTGRCIKDKRR
jgi:serine/threonine protein kinase